MIVTILGSGTSTGVPLIGCDCRTCRSTHAKNKRTRASLHIHYKDKSILIDTSTDLRQQALANKLRKIDFVLYTHPHADHVSGIDEMRSFNFLQKAQIPVFGNAWTCRELGSRFPYIFEPAATQEGGGIPRLTLNEIPPDTPSLTIQGIQVQPIEAKHGSQDCLGYRIDSVAYVTDTSYIPSQSLERLKGLSVLVLDCLRLKPHGTHLNLEQALEVISQLRPKRTLLTHLGHDFEYAKWSKKLPKGVALAYDGLRIKTTERSS